MAARGIGLPLCLVLALLVAASGCDEDAARDTESVKVGGKWFHLEVADTPQLRQQGLSNRTHIAPDGGMIFLFQRPQPLNFVMRDCAIPIDIIFLDGSGRVVAMHEMKVEEPRRPGEADRDYEDRLKRYSSRFDAQFAIELAGGTLPGLGIKEGDRVELDLSRLKARAK